MLQEKTYEGCSWHWHALGCSCFQGAHAWILLPIGRPTYACFASWYLASAFHLPLSVPPLLCCLALLRTVQYIGLRNCIICSGHLCITACKRVYMLVSRTIKRQRGLNPTLLLWTFCIASLFPILPGALLNFPSYLSNIWEDTLPAKANAFFPLLACL